MADFTIVMHEMQRMCDAFTNADECQHCPLVHNPVCGTPSDMTDEEIRKAEAAIMAWAAEHPEPQYPTWFGWLESEGILILETVPCQSKPTSTSTQQSYVAVLRGTPKMYRPIPADIAEKLGIEPKEE